MRPRSAFVVGISLALGCGSRAPRWSTDTHVPAAPQAESREALVEHDPGPRGPHGGRLGPQPPVRGTVGVWEEVTSSAMDRGFFVEEGSFGVGNVVTDPARPTDLYVGGYGSIWKSVDYGATWKKLDSSPNPPEVPLGRVLAVAGTTPATLWVASASGEEYVYRSTNGGLTFELTGLIPQAPDSERLYSIVVDPNDPKHLLSGLHEADKLLESRDSGDTWRFVTGKGFPPGGVSWYPFFVDAGDAATTSRTWFAIAQGGGSAIMTNDGGVTWKKPRGIEDLQHPHGTASFYQEGKTLFVAGIDGPGIGVYRSSDLGETWTSVTSGSGAVVWGSPKRVHAMWGWACSRCSDGAQHQSAPQPGDAGTWQASQTPTKLNWGPNSVATTSDGTHTIFVGSMWATGLWRYIEP